MKTAIPMRTRAAIRPKARPNAEMAGASPIVPPQAIAGRTLVLVIAIMTFLAGFTIAVVSVIDRAANAWASDIGREVTIEVRPLDGVVISAEVDKAVALAQEFPGVGGARGLSDAETQRLLEPWLGPGTDLSALPVPRLVIVSIDDAASFDAKALADAVGRQIRGGSVDDHALWIDRLSAMASSMVFAGIGLMTLMLIALVLSVVFATRAAMAGNRDVIEVLHFCGAEDSFNRRPISTPIPAVWRRRRRHRRCAGASCHGHRRLGDRRFGRPSRRRPDRSVVRPLRTAGNRLWPGADARRGGRPVDGSDLTPRRAAVPVGARLTRRTGKTPGFVNRRPIS